MIMGLAIHGREKDAIELSYGDVEMAQWAYGNLLDLGVDESSAHVLLSNVTSVSTTLDRKMGDCDVYANGDFGLDSRTYVRLGFVRCSSLMNCIAIYKEVLSSFMPHLSTGYCCSLSLEICAQVVYMCGYASHQQGSDLSLRGTLDPVELLVKPSQVHDIFSRGLLEMFSCLDSRTLVFR
ncbi:hypothetical protein L1987_46509 [Smallanthus sonchifolius]|uniref:Uncharacterized protein n=1 Tax=Smallanthus sonchifolius TaxID=185202 RepID=A0ACB9G0H8_9ASTR|nr:hypothetical protein L1987_46509 [Smallanthus sonchifolius]